MSPTCSPSLMLDTYPLPMQWTTKPPQKKGRAAASFALRALAGTRTSRDPLATVDIAVTSDGGASLDATTLPIKVVVPMLAHRVTQAASNTHPELRPQSVLEALSWIKQVTALPDRRIAGLLDVKRQTLHNWLRGSAMTDTNRRRVLVTDEVLRRAAAQHGTGQELKAWLDTPRGPEGVTPAKLLEAGRTDEARYFAVAAPSARLNRAPTWITDRAQIAEPGREELPRAGPTECDVSEDNTAESHAETSGWDLVVDE